LPHGLLESLIDAIGLQALGLATGVIDVLDRKIELILIPVRVAAVLGAAIGERP
jgi:hypothetical protein